MRYRLDVLSAIGPLTTYAVLFTPDISVESYSKRINAPGKMAFSISATNPKATDTLLMPYRRVRLSRQTDEGYLPCWFGYIEDKLEFEGRIDVICNGILGFFAKRFAALNEAFSGQGSTEAFGLLSDCNTDDDTGVTEGDGGVTSTKAVTAQGRIDVLKAWELLAQAHGAEFEIDDDGAFHFVSSLGSDLSSSIRLVFRRDGSPGSTVSSIRLGESGREMATRVIGTTTADGVSPYTYDAATQSTYGVITEVKAFNEAQDAGTLQSMTEAFGSQKENPLPDFQVIPSPVRNVFNSRTGEREPQGMDYFDVSLGCLVGTTIITENRSVTTAKRIIEIQVRIDENGTEKMSFTLSEAGIFITAGYLEANQIEELRRRVQYLDSVIS